MAVPPQPSMSKTAPPSSTRLGLRANVGPVRNATTGGAPLGPVVPGKPNTSAAQARRPATGNPAATVHSVLLFGATVPSPPSLVYPRLASMLTGPAWWLEISSTLNPAEPVPSPDASELAGIHTVDCTAKAFSRGAWSATRHLMPTSTSVNPA